MLIERDARQELVEECGEVCEELGLHMPFSIAVGAPSDHTTLHEGLLAAAHNPAAALAIPLTPSLKVRLCRSQPGPMKLPYHPHTQFSFLTWLQAKQQYRRMLQGAALYTLGGTAAALLVYGAVRWVAWL